MRLIDINIDYSNISQLTVTFSEVTKIGSSIKEQTTNLVKQVTSMATTYSSVKKQADKGEKANYSFEKLQKEGLDSAQYNIFNTDSTFVLDNHGLLGRNYDDVNDSYSDEQVRLNGSDIIFTTDNWKSTELAIGKQKYTLNGNTHEEYSVNAKTVIGGKVISGDIYSANYTTDNKGNLIKGTHFDLTNGSFGIADGKISYDNTLGKLKIKDVAIDWSSSSNPSVDNIEGLDDKLNDITETIDENLSKKYPTTTQMNSAIAKSAEGIKSQVSKTYTTKTEFADLKIGGRNLFLNSLTWKNAFFSNDGVTIDGEVAYMSQAALPKSTPVYKTTDNNTTYSLSKSGSTITLTGSDGSKTSVSDSDTNTTYPIAYKTIDGSFITKYRTQTKGNTANGDYISTIRTEASGVNYAPQFGSGLAWGRGDTHGYLYTAYPFAEAYLGGGNADTLNWVKRIQFTDGTGASGTWGINITGNANTATSLGGYPYLVGSTGKDSWGTVPVINGSDGVMEVGKYIDFHASDGSKVDYDVRIIADVGGLTITGTTSGTFTGNLLGNATTATALTSSAGNSQQPVYFSGGKPVACTYTLGKSVPSNAVFTDTWRGIQNNLISTSTIKK